ncbi:MAG: IS3 family transposase, partial [Betaproteobacteria bacterium]|nr:IS3 family transposase [Betaproteobacteria bacterium]
MESFWGTLKTNLSITGQYHTRSGVTQEITEYIEIFYNRYRRHSRLGYLSPVTFTQQFYAEQLQHKSDG